LENVNPSCTNTFEMLISVKITPEVRQHAARMYMHRLALLLLLFYPRSAGTGVPPLACKSRCGINYRRR
jgi:hypothetical protein